MRNFIIMNAQIKIGLFIAIIISFGGCDYIITPLKPKTIITSNDTSKIYKNVLVEDYTGSTCVNCPPAASELDSLISTYGNRIVPLSVNAGNFAVPVPTYTLNLQCGTADIYDGTFQMSATGNPCGMVNRKGSTLAAKYMLWTTWATATQNIILNDTAFVKIVLSTTFDTTSRALIVTATSTFLKQLSGTYNLVILLTQDSIVGPQKSGTAGEIANYVHRFVLRDAINGTWGEALVTGGATANQAVVKTYNYTINSSYPASGTTTNPTNKPAVPCNFKKCSIVAYIYDASTTSSPTQYEVLQSMQKKIYP